MAQQNLTNNIYVLLSDTGTCFTRLIQGFTGAPFNHASLVLDTDLQEVYSFGRKHAKNPLFAGFVKEDVYEGTFRQFPNTRCVLLRISVTAKQRASILQVIQTFKKNKDSYRYNLIGLLGVLFNVDLKLTDSYFCSQFVAEALRSSDVNLWERPSALVTPNDFLLHGKFEVVYEGLLYEYPRLNRKRLALYQKQTISTRLIGKRAI
ncbi:hypothetical protein BK133_01655 [Paenibacillus sp. FSL H8-0548]|nr:hypothetical protein BK133_01655 [Paenibacillus sp. FSL H8-0548]